VPDDRRRRRCDASRAGGADARGGAAQSSDPAAARAGRPLHLEAAPDPAGRRPNTRARVRRTRQDAQCGARRVIAKRLEREGTEGRLLLGKHDGDLPLRRAVNARVGPPRFPAIQVRLRRRQTFTAERFSARGPRPLPFSYAIRITDATRERDDGSGHWTTVQVGLPQRLSAGPSATCSNDGTD
jgi:hypothetical protein